MKRSIIFYIVSIVLSLPVFAQEALSVDEAIYVYRNDSTAFTGFLRSELDSIVLSKYTVDSVLTNTYQTQDFYSRSGVTRIPLAAIDSVTFKPIENKPKYNIIDIEPWMDYYRSHGTEDMWLSFSSSMPYDIKVGDVLKYGKSTEEFRYGFMGQVRSVQYGDSILVRCDAMNIDDVFDEFMFFDAIALESYVEEVEGDAPGQTKYQTRFRVANTTVDENGILRYDHSKDIKVKDLIEKGEEWWEAGEDALNAAAEFLEEVAENGYADKVLVNEPLKGKMNDLLDKKRVKALEVLCENEKYKWLDNFLKAVTIEGSWDGNITLRLAAYKQKLMPLKLKFTSELELHPSLTAAFGWKKDYNFQKDQEDKFGVFADCAVPIVPPANFGGWFFYEVGAEFYAIFNCDAELSITWEPSVHTTTSVSYDGLTWPKFETEYYDVDPRKFKVNVSFDGEIKEGIDIVAEFSCLNGFLHAKGGAAPRVRMKGKFDSKLFGNDPSDESTHPDNQDLVNRLLGNTEVEVGVGVDFPVMIEAKIPADDWVPDWKWLKDALKTTWVYSDVFEWEPAKVKGTALPKFKSKPKITLDRSEGKDMIDVEVEYKAACLDGGLVGIGIGTWEGDKFKLLASDYDDKPASVDWQIGFAEVEERDYTKFKAKFTVSDPDKKFSVFPYYKYGGLWPVRCGEESTFRFSDMSVKVGEAVDLGLSDGTLWSDANFGGSGYADIPYFAWGESKGDKTDYSDKSYTISFVNEKSEISNTFKDPVRNLWRDGWSMPTSDDWKTLIKECNWKWCEENGVYGYRISNKDPKKSMKSIFLPAYGYKSGTAKSGYNTKCVYASGTKPSFDVVSLVCGATTVNGLTTDVLETVSPYWGMSIRPVKKELKVLPLSTDRYVDMGLSVDWASCNFGTTNPYLNSKYYSLGEREGGMPDGRVFNKDNYSYQGRTSEFPPCISGTSYDAVAATTKSPSGEEYRMPTDAEWLELMRECDWQWYAKNGMTGYYITSRKTDGKIFLPATGYMDGNINRSVLAECVYLSGNVAQNGTKASALVIGEDASDYKLSVMEPYWGYQIRSVRQKNKPEPTYGEMQKHMSVDMGLSVDWSNLNLGASHYYEAGDFYSWGDDKAGKKRYDQATYDLSRDFSLIKSQISDTGFDAAKKNLGEGWRLPTKQECDELINKCDWKVTTMHGVRGYLVTARNGKSIFLPAVGEHNDLVGIMDENIQKGLRVGKDKHLVLMAGDKGNAINKMGYALQAEIEKNDICIRQRQAAIGYSVRPVRDTSLRPVTVTTLDPSAVAGTKATLNATTGEGVSSSHSEAKLFFEYGTAEDKLDHTKQVRPVAGTNVSGFVSDLKPNTTYFYRIRFTYKEQATGKAVEESGDVKSFTTLTSDGDVVLSLQDIMEVSSKTATVMIKAENVELTSVGNNRLGAIYMTEKAYKQNGSNPPVLGAKGVLSKYATTVTAHEMKVHLTDLSYSTSYYVRPFAVVDGKAYYGDVKQVATLSNLNIITHEAEDVTSCSAYVQATSEALDFTKMAEKNMGIIYADIATYALLYKDNPDAFRYQARDVLREVPWDAGNGYMDFSLIDLKKNTTYYYRPFVIVDGVLHYGQTKRFTTLSDMQITTDDATNVQRSSALVSGMAKNPFVDEDYEAGFCWNTTGDPTYANGEHIVCQPTNGSMSCVLTNLHPSTTYYYRTYMYVRGRLEYGEVKTFTTRTAIYVDNSSHEYVDYKLSSGTLWATHDIMNTTGTGKRYFCLYDNFGTDEVPYEIVKVYYEDGPYYGMDYYWDVVWKDDVYRYPKYPKYEGVITDSEGHLLPEYDPVTLIWGEDWRMPTLDELYELHQSLYSRSGLSELPDRYLGYGGRMPSGTEVEGYAYFYMYDVSGCSLGKVQEFWVREGYCIRPVYKKKSYEISK